MLLLLSADLFFPKFSFSNNSFKYSIDFQIVWIQFRNTILSVLIWVQTVCKGQFSMLLFCLPTFFKNNFFQEHLSECQMVCIQIKTKMFAKVICRLFSKLMFFKNTFRTTYNVRLSNSSYPDQDQHNVSPDLG